MSLRSLIEELQLNWEQLIIPVSLILSLIVLFVIFARKSIDFLFSKIDRKFHILTSNSTEKLRAKRYIFHSLLGLFIIFCTNISHINDSLSTGLSHLLNTFILIYISFSLSALVLSAINIIAEHYKEYFVSKHFPVHLPLQILKIFIVSFTSIVVIARIADISPISILTSLGAATAFLTFVFKDAISGLIASLQLIFQNKIQIGDWINVPQYNLKGTVEKITITEVKIRVGNGSIIIIPPYNLLTTNIINFRGITKAKSRAINRTMHIDINSIAFLPANSIEKLSGTISHIDITELKLDASNYEKQVTNFEIFKLYAHAFIKEYLAKNSHGNNFQIFEAENTGPGYVLLEINIFLKKAEWDKYENMNSEVFSRLVAILPEFQLKLCPK